MPAQSIVLVNQTTTVSNNLSQYTYSAKQKGDGYDNVGDGKHTVVFLFDNFKGAVKMQATLAIDPTEADWFDVTYDLNPSDLTALDSTPLVTAEYRNFTGNFTWIRAGYILQQGTIREIRYNH
jgi:hypothetical protein